MPTLRIFLLFCLFFVSTHVAAETRNVSLSPYPVDIFTGLYTESTHDLKIGSFTLQRSFSPHGAERQNAFWHFNIPYLLSFEYDPANIDSRLFVFDKEKRLTAVYSPENRALLFTCIYSNLGSNRYRCSVKGSDGDYVNYTYFVVDINKKKIAFIDSVETKEFFASYRYTYGEVSPWPIIYQIDKKKLEEIEPTLYFSYDKNQLLKDPIARIIEVKSSDPFGNSQTLAKLTYLRGQTDIRTEKSLISYQYSNDNYVDTVKTFLSNSSGQMQLYHQQHFFWQNKESTPELTFQVLTDDQGEFLVSTSYEYDHFGNVTQKYLYDYKTGEKFLQDWSYNDQGQLSLSKDSSGLVWSYSYLPNSKFIAKKSCFAPDPKLFYAYFYDEKNRPIETSLHASTQLQHSCKLTYLEDTPLAVKTEEFIEGALKQYTINEFNSEKNLICQHLFLEGDHLQHSLFYNSQGLITERYEPSKGTTYYTYNLNKKITSQTFYDLSGKKSYEEYLYDACGRLTSKQSLDKNGIHLTTSYQYNLLGQCTAQTDTFGNEIGYSYDGLNRLSKVTYPKIYDDSGQQKTPCQFYEYDLFNRLKNYTDQNGHTTSYEYNFLNKPLLIAYPDGTKEFYTYASTGHCIAKRNRDGTLTKYSYDGLGNVVRESQHSKEGDELFFVTHSYSGQKRISTVDPYGKVTHYDLDGKSSQLLFDGAITTLSSDPTEKSFSLTHSFSEESSEKITYKIDQQKVACSDSLGNLLQEFNLEKNGLEHINLEPRYNSHQQLVASYTIFDSESGSKKVVTLDALGHLSLLEQYDCFGALVKKIVYNHDALGNKTKEEHYKLNDDDVQYSFLWQWGPCGQLEQTIELANGAKPKITSYEYNNFGLLATLTNPDGICISYSYDSAARLQNYKSSDGAVDFSFSYNSFSQCTEAKNNLTNQSVERSFNALGKIASEKQLFGQKLLYSYDSLERKTALVLPDNSSIEYQYSGPHLSNVNRLDPSGALLYDYHYLCYNLNGKVLEAELPKDCGKISYSYDSLGRLLSTVSSYWQESLCQDFFQEHTPYTIETKDSAGLYEIELSFNSANNLTSAGEENFSYDALGNIFSEQTPCQYNQQLQLIKKGSTSFYYDDNGNLIKTVEKERSVDFEYNCLGQLVKVSRQESYSYIYTYDPFGRRASSSCYSNNNDLLKQTLYLYDGDQELGEWNEKKSSFDVLRILGLGIEQEIGAAIAIEKGSELFLPIHDRQGNIRCLVDAQEKKAAQTYHYSAFGEKQVFTAEGEEAADNSSLIPWGWSSKRYDMESELLYFGKRFYFPKLCRWTSPDPLGMVDGPNRYTYAKNNPYLYVDPCGTSSFSLLLDTLFSPFKMIAKKAADFYHNQLNSFGDMIFGDLYYNLEGDIYDVPAVGVYGDGEADPLIRITMINGLFNTNEHARIGLKMVSELHGGVNIHYVFRHTRGAFHDLLCGFFVKLGYVSPYARQLANTWKTMIAEMGGVGSGGLICHYAHSMGGSDTFAAKSLMSDEELKMISVITFGSPTLFSGYGFANVTNIVSLRDSVCWLDPFAYLKGAIFSTNISFAGTLWGPPFFDHWLSTETYRQVLAALGADFVKIYIENKKP